MTKDTDKQKSAVTYSAGNDRALIRVINKRFLKPSNLFELSPFWDTRLVLNTHIVHCMRQNK